MLKGDFIETERLRIVPMTYDFVLKIMNGDSSAYELLGAIKTESWPEKADIRNILHMISNSLKDKDTPDGFDAWLFIDKKDSSIVGDGGFKGVPNENGLIDIGYAIIEAKRKQGFGFEAVSALFRWGMAQPLVKGITADCLEDNLPSTRILSKLGLHESERKEGLIYFKSLQC